MSIDPNRIGMREFVRLLRPHIKIGDNGDFVIDENGVRAVGIPDSKEINKLGLGDKEIDALLTFDDECQLAFPATIEQVHDWASSVLDTNHPELKLMEADLILNQDDPKASVLWFKMPETILDLCRARKAPHSADDAPISKLVGGASETTASSAFDASTEIPERPRGGKDINSPAIKVAIGLMREHPKMDKIEACRQAVDQCFPELAESENDLEHERKPKADLRESKAKCLSSGIRTLKAKQKQSIKP